MVTDDDENGSETPVVGQASDTNDSVSRLSPSQRGAKVEELGLPAHLIPDFSEDRRGPQAKDWLFAKRVLAPDMIGIDAEADVLREAGLYLIGMLHERRCMLEEQMANGIASNDEDSVSAALHEQAKLGAIDDVLFSLINGQRHPIRKLFKGASSAATGPQGGGTASRIRDMRLRALCYALHHWEYSPFLQDLTLETRFIDNIRRSYIVPDFGDMSGRAADSTIRDALRDKPKPYQTRFDAWVVDYQQLFGSWPNERFKSIFALRYCVEHSPIAGRACWRAFSNSKSKLFD